MVRLDNIIIENKKSDITVNSAKEVINGKYPFFTSGKQILSYNDFIIDNENLYLSTGGNAIVKFYNGKAAYSTDTYCITTKDNIKPYYLYQLLQFIINDINIYMFQGIALKHLQKNDLKNIKIPLPPLNIQQKIVDECEAVDNAAEQAEKIIKENQKTIAEKMQKVIDGGYEIKRLEEIINTVESGNRPKGGVGNISSGALSLGGEHIHPNNGKIILKTPKYVSLDFYEGSKRGILKENDILMCKDGYPGKVAFLKKELNEKKAMINEHVFILRCDNLIKQKYIFQYLFSDNGQRILKENVTGAIIGGLNSTNLKNIKIPVPPLKVQQQLVSEIELLEEKITSAREIVENISDEKNKILEKYL